jgi:NDP-sugar pyrophosphorylase family protein
MWLYPALTSARPGAVRVWMTAASFHDIGTPADYLRTATSIAAAEGMPLDRGARADIAPTAIVERSVCWDDVRVGAGARVFDCVLADGVRVPADLHVSRASVVLAAGVAPRPGSRVVGDLLIAPFDGE